MSHWDKHAKQWCHIGAPLRPSSEDVAAMCFWIKDIFHNPSSFNVLILGVTPELAEIPWPENTCLFVIDANFAMVNAILLKRKLPIFPLISIGNWLQLPFDDSFFNLVIGDGCYSMLAENNYDKLSDEIVRVLSPTGYFFMRFFIRPESRESLDAIQEDLLAGTIANFHILKWRIAMALHGTLEQGVCLDEIWLVWNKRFNDSLDYLQWPHQIVRTIDVYKNNSAFYTFPTFDEISLKLQGKFTALEKFIPDYELGARCPTLKLKPVCDL